MLFLRIKQAEVALADGRLDEACDLVLDDEVRAHRQGQKLATKLVGKLANRAEQHLKQDRVVEAQRDLRRAERLGGNQQALASVSMEIRERIADSSKRREQQQQVLRAVRTELNRGEWSLGGKLLERLSDSCSQAGLMADELEIRRATSTAAIERARDALARGEFDDATTRILDVARDFPAHPEAATLLNAFAKLATTQFEDQMQAGRLDRAELMLRRLRPLFEKSVELAALKQTVSQCRACAEAVQQFDFRGALRIARQLETALPDADWVGDIVRNARQAADSFESLQASPLGQIVICEQTVVPVPAAQQADHSPTEKPQPAVAKDKAAATSNKWLLQVDGAGAFLILTTPQPSFGPSASSGHAVDVKFQGTLPVFHIDRQQDDYFLRADGDIEVNRAKVRSKLLASGDRLQAGRRAGMKFLVPHPASASAVLELGTAKLSRPDIRRIVLCDDSVVIGDARNAHVPVSSGEVAFVIVLRAGRFECRPIGRNVDAAQVQDVLPGQKCQMGSVSFQINRV